MRMRFHEILCYGIRFQCYTMRFAMLCYIVKDILELTLIIPFSWSSCFHLNTRKWLCCKYHFKVFRKKCNEITSFEHMEVINDFNLNKNLN